MGRRSSTSSSSLSSNTGFARFSDRRSSSSSEMRVGVRKTDSSGCNCSLSSDNVRVGSSAVSSDVVMDAVFLSHSRMMDLFCGIGENASATAARLLEQQRTRDLMAMVNESN